MSMTYVTLALPIAVGGGECGSHNPAQVQNPEIPLGALHLVSDADRAVRVTFNLGAVAKCCRPAFWPSELAFRLTTY